MFEEFTEALIVPIDAFILQALVLDPKKVVAR